MNPKYKALLEGANRCELCGSNKNLEIHHIVPRSVQSYGVDLDGQENLVIVCQKCHALLTPRGILTKIGQRKSQYKYSDKYRLYKRLGERLEEYGGTNTSTIMDIVFETIEEVYEQENK